MSSAIRFNLNQSKILLSGNGLTLFPQSSPCFYVSKVQIFENIVGKGEIAHNKQFLLFPTSYLPFLRTLGNYHQIWKYVISSVKSFSLEESKLCFFGKY